MKTMRLYKPIANSAIKFDVKEWSGSSEYTECLINVISTLNNHYKPKEVVNIYSESKVFWLNYS
jgi:hypothetical protein